MKIEKKHYKTKIATMHPIFNVLGTNTQRNSSSCPNSQQFPTRGIFHSRILECLSTLNKDEYLMLNSDFSQLEARLACNDYYQKNSQADYTKDPLYSLFNNNEGDFHSLTAYNVFTKNHQYKLLDIILEYENGNKETFGSEEYIDCFNIKAKNIKIGDISQDKSKIVKNIVKQENIRNVKNAKEEAFLKGVEPFKSFRQKSKTINFALLYGASYLVVFKLCIENQWLEKELDDYILENNLQNSLDKDIEREKRKKEKAQQEFQQNSQQNSCQEPQQKTLYEIKGFIVAKDIRQKFLDSYPSLCLRIKQSEDYANKKGYAQCYYGYKRKLGKLKYFDSNSPSTRRIFENEKKSLNNIEIDYKKSITELKHISVNTDIQSVEMHKISTGINTLYSIIKKYNLKSRIFNTVHDSICLYVFIPEIKIIYDLMKEIFLKQNEEDVIKLDMEFTYSRLGLLDKNRDSNDLEKSIYLEYYENGRDYEETYKSLIDEGYVIYQNLDDCVLN